MNLGFPYQFDGCGRTAQADDADYIKKLIKLMLFTSPNERINRPDFGCGLLQQVFAPNSDSAAAALQFLVQGALQKWLGDLIVVEGVAVDAVDAALAVSVQYVVRDTQAREVQTFTTGGSP
jgi:phage baseplate assembly protein W